VEVETAPSSRTDDEASRGKSYAKTLYVSQNFVGVGLPLIYHTSYYQRLLEI